MFGQALADWPMPGHDAQRTSCSTETFAACTVPVWCVQFDPYIPSRACIVTKAAEGGVPDTVYVTAVDGIHALNPANGSQRWLYPMSMAPGDAPTIVGTTMYVSGMDKTIHAVNCADGTKIWQTDTAGAAFYVNPLVVGTKIYAGCRDGYFYCFNAADGSLAWYYNVGAPIAFSASYQTYTGYPEGLIFFADVNCRAYAIRADNPNLVWSRQLEGESFVAWWPVVTQQRVLFGASTNYPTTDNDLRGLQREILAPSAAALNDGNGNYQLSHHINWLIQYPQRNTFFVLDAITGSPQEQSPFLFWGNPGGQRFPASVASDNRIWLDTPWEDSWFGTGRYGGWDKATTVVRPTIGGWESSDEPSGQALIGNHLYFNDGGDGVDKGGIYNITTGADAGSWTNATFRAPFGNYWGNWLGRKYGNNFHDGAGDTWSYSIGHHGHQNPPTPLNGKVYFHRSNAVICMGS
jgi:hypothetical protein